MSWLTKRKDDENKPLIVKAYQWASDHYSTKIDPDELRFGDIVTHVYNCDKKTDFDGTVGDIPRPEISGHVFLFDKWEDDTHTTFWGYESTKTFDITPECKAQKHDPIDWVYPACKMHHVQKQRSRIINWETDSCTSKDYGHVTGGARRLLPGVLCPPTDEAFLI